MLTVQWQREPYSGAGAAKFGGRWNRQGTPALYLSLDHQTAIAEYYQTLVRPGTLVAYDIDCNTILDLTGIDPAISLCPWRHMWRIDRAEPPTWVVVDEARKTGIDGAIVGSVQRPGWHNLVLWKWSPDGSEGAKTQLVDPDGELGL